MKKSLLILLTPVLVISMFFSPLISNNHSTAYYSGNSQVSLTVAVEIGNVFYIEPELDYIVEKLADWGFTVCAHNESQNDYNSTFLEPVDILLMTSLAHNLSENSLNAIANWYNAGGGKGLWVGGDNNYIGENDDGAARDNRILELIGSSIFIEGTSVESEVNFLASYRVKANRFATTGEAVKLVQNIPHQAALFHGPAAVIGYDSLNEEYIPLEDSQPYGVEWVVKTDPDSTIEDTYPLSNSPYKVHERSDTGSFVMMALQVLNNSNKLIVSAESIFATYKEMFEDPGENGIPHDDPYIVYNTLMWLSGMERDTNPPEITSASLTAVNTSHYLATWEGTDTGSTICSYDLYLNDVYNMTVNHEKENHTFTGGVTEETNFTVIARDYAGNEGGIPDSSTSGQGTPGFEYLAVLSTVLVAAVTRNYRKRRIKQR